MEKDKSQPKIFTQVQKVLKWCMIGFLYLLFVYWAGQSIHKYVSEPTVTTFKSSLGDENNQIRFPLVTFCEQKFADYPEVFNKICNLNISIGLDPWGYPGFGFDQFSWVVPIGNKTYHRYLHECLEKEPNVNLTGLLEELKSYEVNDFIFMTYLVNASGQFIIEKTDYEYQWSSTFHPIHGYCHTFQLKNNFSAVYGIDTTIQFQINKTNMIAFFHGKHDLPDETNANVQFGTIPNDVRREWVNVAIGGLFL